MYNKSIFKWAGSKNKALPHLLPILEKHKKSTFVEPFVGAANVSLNFVCDNYIWNDLNSDLISTYGNIFRKGIWEYIQECEIVFCEGFDQYYYIRGLFNKSQEDSFTRNILFQYLNKHGFNGLCRYNKKGGFNVPVGTRTKKPKQVPLEQIKTLYSRHKDSTKLSCKPFEEIFWLAESMEDVLNYCDPPYVPLTTDFKYTKGGFNEDDHVKLKTLAHMSKHTTIISNHWTEFTQDLYQDADEIYTFPVQRTISCDGGGRKKVEEVVAVYLGWDKQ